MFDNFFRWGLEKTVFVLLEDESIVQYTMQNG